ncbi:MAG: hypothetical protein HDS82_00300 [Bacteroidales bacterium]|nr:hypothetical protein [Bacteroidales bacterium]
MKNLPFWRRKYVWLPTLLSIYFIIMALRFGVEMIAAGRIWSFIGIAAGEIFVLVILVIFLRKRENIKHRT